MKAAYETVYLKDIKDQYNCIRGLGQGAFGKVLLVEEKATGKRMAMKMVRKDRTQLNAFLTELDLSISLACSHAVIQTYPLFIDTMDYYVMTQEIAKAGTLHHLIKPEVGLPEIMVKRCALQVARALDFMHSRGLVHRDIKPDNVLVMDKACRKIKLCDFGLTQAVGSSTTSFSHIIPFMSPELCVLKNPDILILNPSIDCWSFGVLLYVSLTGNLPWKGAVEGDVWYQVYKYWQNYAGHFPPPAHWAVFTQEALKMFNKFLSPEPSTRLPVLSIISYIHHDWMNEERFTECQWIDISDEMDESTEEEDEVIEVTDDTKQYEVTPVQDEKSNDTSLQESDAGDDSLVVMSDDSTLSLGSEVEIP